MWKKYLSTFLKYTKESINIILLSVFHTFQQNEKVDKSWVIHPHCVKLTELSKTLKCKNVITLSPQSEKGFNKGKYEISTVFHNCGKTSDSESGFHVEKLFFNDISMELMTEIPKKDDLLKQLKHNILKSGKEVSGMDEKDKEPEYLTDSLRGILKGNYDLEEEKRKALEEKYEKNDQH